MKSLPYIFLGAIVFAFAGYVLVDRYFLSSTSLPSYTFDLDFAQLSYNLPQHSTLCIPNSSQYCQGDNCEPIKPTVFLLINKQEHTYSRCDKNPCDTYPASFTQSGIYTIIRPDPPIHGEIKISSDRSYIETNTLAGSVYINRGQCRSGF